VRLDVRSGGLLWLVALLGLVGCCTSLLYIGRPRPYRATHHALLVPHQDYSDDERRDQAHRHQTDQSAKHVHTLQGFSYGAVNEWLAPDWHWGVPAVVGASPADMPARSGFCPRRKGRVATACRLGPCGGNRFRMALVVAGGEAPGECPVCPPPLDGGGPGGAERPRVLAATRCGWVSLGRLGERDCRSASAPVLPDPVAVAGVSSYLRP
jgi:hypothetical protein